MQTTPKTSAAAVSARLKRAGFTTVATRNLEGIRVSKGVLGEVHIVVDHDSDRSAKRVADLLADLLEGWEGYKVRRSADVHFYVAKADPADEVPADVAAPAEPGTVDPWFLLGYLRGYLTQGTTIGPAEWAASLEAAAKAHRSEQGGQA